MRPNFRILMAGVALCALAACVAPGADTQSEPAQIGDWGFDLSGMDAAVDPGDDFFRYANGGWLDATPMPADQARIGAFPLLREHTDAQVAAIIADLEATQYPQGSVERKIGDFYRSWMDTDALERRGLAPLQPHLDTIDAIESREDLMGALANFHATRPFQIRLVPDPADTTRYAVLIGQGGLGLPDREFYLADDPRMANARETYRAYIATLNRLAGYPDADERAASIVALETRIAESHWTAERSRQLSQMYNPMDRAALEALAPAIDWARVLEANGLGGVDSFIVGQTTAIEAANGIVGDTPLATWKAYLAFHFMSSNASFLPAAFDEASFDLYSRALRGVETQPARADRGVQQLNAGLGEAIGQIYVERYLPPRAEAEARALFEDLRAALADDLQSLDWMDDATADEALRKLQALEARIGRPAEWTDYSALEIGDDLLANGLALRQFQWREITARLDGPVDRSAWNYPPQTVNATYDAGLNQATFPAGVLQPPFFDANADPAVNYGAIGALIGHEISHGFDDQGRRFDGEGLVRDWWTPETAALFVERTQRLTQQFSLYRPLEDTAVNGELTLGENIGDLGGLEIAWAAWERYKAAHGEPEILDGFTADQRFFLAYAQTRRDKYRDDALREMLLTDPHSPAEYRVNGILRNFDPWYAAFDVTADDALYLPPTDRVSVW